ncbi:IS5 family transposase [Burkholderia glumae]|uniref:IS5 family transposase n=1 Tax=Burkholderia glumae TaxID=337 RepID=UPI0013743908|nr:IS5 family transposase [Burkholderia glumae]MCR1769543.1 IS5 family transposase [Burkholderia glumae]QHP92644.1 IS5 family transposase [Burkholderia glumae]
MARRKISNELWVELEPLIPEFAPSPKGGRRRTVDDRAALNGILYVLQAGIPQEDLPQELGFGSGMTCWRRLRDWQAAGVWHRLHLAMLRRLREHDQIDWERASLDGASVSSPPGGQKTGPNPTDRGELGSKRHIVTDANSPPLAAILTGANVSDITQWLPLIDAIAPIRGLRGHPLRRPRVVYADGGYDSEPHRRALRDRGIEPVIARRRTEHGSGLGKYRWVVERTHAWRHHFRRLRIRFERRADIHGAFLKLGCCSICWNTLQRTQPSL